MQERDLLLEIGCEELPATQLLKLVESLEKAVSEQLAHYELSFKEIQAFATPRRLSLIVKGLATAQASRSSERQGPSMEAAYDKNGTPTLACLGFAKSCGVSIDQLEINKTEKGSWVFCKVQLEGKKTADLLPELMNTALKNVSLSKSMRWGAHEIEFIRPVRWVVLLFGNELMNASLLGKVAGRITYGHRFHHPEAIHLDNPSTYVEKLRQHKVIANFEERRNIIRELIGKAPSHQARALIDEDLLNEVTGLVEWPILHLGHFDRRFLDIPKEVLICSMKTHQKTFPMVNAAGVLQPYFLVISNIESKFPSAIISGNERVINARLSDAEFFYKNDLKKSLEDHLPALKKLIFQKELGSVGDKAHRMAHDAEHMAKLLELDTETAKRAGLLAKCDLVSDMVKEFPELQGVMGYYYALNDQESKDCALAIKEHYQPRFAGDQVAESKIGAILAIGDKLDTLIGILGINKKPTGDKDPFGLRRAALGVIRSILEKEFSLDLMNLLKFVAKSYKTELPNAEVAEDCFEFIMERLKSFYAEQDISSDVFEAVRARQPTDLLDFAQRINAVKAFQQLPEATSLAEANKRVNNILKKQETHKSPKVHENLFVDEAEKDLYLQLNTLQEKAVKLYEEKKYKEALSLLSKLNTPINTFFDQVMIMTDDKKVRENRLALLQALQDLFSLVADLSMINS